MAMTKAERDQLLSLVRKREKVMRAKAVERSAALLAEFDAQSAKVYHFDEDSVWAAAVEESKVAIEKAQSAIAARCAKLGILAEFTPTVQMSWSGRGHNAVSSRRQELRQAAKSKIAAVEKEALSAIEAMSLEAQTNIVANGLESEAAKIFLNQMPAIEKLMPPVQVSEMQKLIESKRTQGWRSDFNSMN